ncbi:MAG: hypothetical protein KBT04_02430 [Bacteroidales bacterium]|nr:hypothetical protein [Candidatus Colimorpha onthohippi]
MKASKTLLFVAIVIAALAAIAFVFPTQGLVIGGKHILFPSIAQIITPKEKELNVTEYLSEADSIQLQQMASIRDSINYYEHLITESDTRFWFPENNANFFAPLFAQLDSAQNHKRTIRILHYGDSQIEMDRLTNRIRAAMQHQFGGGGPGLQPFAPIIRSATVQHSSSGYLVHQAPYGDSTVRRANGRYGLLVNSHHLSGNASAYYTPGRYKTIDDCALRFNQITLIYDNQGKTLTASIKKATEDTILTHSDTLQGVRSLHWTVPKGNNSKLQITVGGSADLYGVALDNGPGVAVDNIPLRGCSGQQFCQINKQQLSDAYRQLDIGLIIMQFGGNSVPYLRNQKNTNIYAESLGKQIDLLHQCCPNAQILFVGPSDMSTTENGQYITYPFLPNIIQTLADTATAHGAAYWSIYHAMGGLNSMKAWCNQNLGTADHIHFTQKGADLMGDRMAQALMNAYHYYRLLNDLATKQSEIKTQP